MEANFPLSRMRSSVNCLQEPRTVSETAVAFDQLGEGDGREIEG